MYIGPTGKSLAFKRFKSNFNLIIDSQKKYWTAIERFKEAIKIDADNHLAMYYVSIIYAILDKKDAEHRMLEFLLKVRRKKKFSNYRYNDLNIKYVGYRVQK
jgi:hypothetical protein